MIGDSAPHRPPRLRDITAIALPMVVSQASETVMLFVDRLFLSRLGKLYIAASWSAGLTTFTVMSLFLGIIGYVNAVVAQNDGAGRPRACARSVAQALRLALVGWPILILMIPLVRLFFQGMGHLPDQVDLEMTYFSILIYGSILGLTRTALAGFFIGLGRTRVVMAANIAGMVMNVPANWILIFGKFGLPAMGIAGAAYGTLIGTAAINMILAAVYFSKKYRRDYQTHREWRFDKKLAKVMVEFGSPAGVETFLNVAAFNFFVQLMHSYGPDTAAAVTIAFNYDMVAFIPMLGLGFAATTLSGRYVGARNIAGAERSTWLTLRVGGVYASVMMALFVFAARPLVNVFAAGLEGGGESVAPLARTILRLAAIYTLADATQLIFAGALRGAGDTKYVMRISVALHWGFAVIAWFAIKRFAVPPVTMWVIFIGFVITLGAAMYLRYRIGPWRGMSLVEDKEPGDDSELVSPGVGYEDRDSLC